MTRHHQPKINFETLRAFVASFFAATNVLTPFVWNETAVRRAFVTLMQENGKLRPFGQPMLTDGAYHAVFTWFRGDCVDVVDGRRDMVKLNDMCLRRATEGRPLLDEVVRAEIARLGPEFYRRTQLAA